MSDAATAARRWLEVDPDPETRAETVKLLADGGSALEERFGGRLEFGTAGIRGAMGAGPMRMNRVLARATAAAVGRVLLADHEAPTVAIGYDARRQSDLFAEDSARVLAGLGVASLLLPGPLPTPVLAHTLLRTGAQAGIMVTASHNPRPDNGIKVYWSDGAQIVAPIDSRISALIEEQFEVGVLPDDDDLADPDHPLLTRGTADDIESYVVAAAGLSGVDMPHDLVVAYTPLHGVGRTVLVDTLTLAGFAPPHVVAEQAEPDGAFPTVEFPNPEEPGVLDLVLALADDVEADLAIANDPDADRLAVAIPTGSGWRPLTGDEIGGLLAEHILSGGAGGDRLVVTTLVSSRLLSAQAAHHGVRYADTLTGFKWIVRPGLADPSARFVFGYEEALGYLVGDLTHDKDGITASVAFAELAAAAKAAGRSVLDLLHDLWRRHGVHRTALRSVRFDGPDGDDRMAALLAGLRASPPTEVAGHPVLAITDYAQPGTGLAPADLLALDLDGGRLLLRPSGTEPMLKVYGEVVGAVRDDDVAVTEAAADASVATLVDAAVALLIGSGT
ncbi:MAG: phospho-sugar mutase [Actinobacteria bacterium]|nr:phospho-sugar mutase [Actinomycetota bacterium]